MLVVVILGITAIPFVVAVAAANCLFEPTARRCSRAAGPRRGSTRSRSHICVVLIAVCVAGLASILLAEDVPKPPVDLNKPVENPKLVAALNELDRHPDPQTQSLVYQRLTRAVFLVPVVASDMQMPTPMPNGGFVLQKDARMAILLASDPDGKPWLPLFTDWRSLSRWTNRAVSTLVMPAAGAWDIVLSHEAYAGAVVNPSDQALRLNRTVLEQFRRSSAAPHARAQRTRGTIARR